MVNEPSARDESYRVPLKLRLDLIPPLVLQRLAAIYEEGAQKYGPGKYLTEPLPDHVIYNHLMNHLLLWASGDSSEDNLAKVMWGTAALMTLEEYTTDKDAQHTMTRYGAMKNASNA